MFIQLQYLWYFSFTVSPILTLLPGQSPYHINVNQQAQLSCIAIGSPLPTVQWFSNGIAVSDAKQVQVSVTVQTGYPHSAVYTCVGINNFANREHKWSSNITVIVGGMSIHISVLVITVDICGL